MKRGPIQWLLGIAVGADETANAALAGDPHHTISARTGYAFSRGKTWAKVAQPVINTLLGSDSHCYDAAVEEGLITPEPPTPPAPAGGGPQPDDPPY